MQSLKSIIGKKLKAARQAKGLSQEELAAAIDRSVHAVSQIERGVNAPSVETLTLLAKELQLSMETLTATPSDTAKPKTARREGLEFSLLAEVDRLNDKQLEALITVARTYS